MRVQPTSGVNSVETVMMRIPQDQSYSNLGMVAGIMVTEPLTNHVHKQR